jgi:hypothetical protein
MRRFILTSSKFNGQIELVYSGLRLESIRFNDCNLDVATMQKFLIIISSSITVEAMTNQMRQYNHMVVVEADFEVSLDDFKREYPYSRNYHLLAKRWDKMNKTEQVEAYYAAIEYRKYCNRTEWYKAKIADSWLANKEYKNDWRKM